MAKQPIVLSKNDFDRVVLMDVLPYELPFILTNEGFYATLHNNTKKSDTFITTNKFLNDLFFSNNVTETYPLNYKIHKDQNSERTLSLIHPKAQINFIHLYKKHYQFILYLCSKSSYSLRHPSQLTYAYHKKQNNEIDTSEKFKDENINLAEEDPIYTSSFFEYQRYAFLYKFYDSYEFQRIEKRFNFLYKFDIAKCFPSISTFQLSKSLRGNISHNTTKNLHSFEKDFENIMLFSNADNSHGIVVGPEFSRVFAEIILQNIDVKIKTILANQQIIEGHDYIIKRYVDDYFLFFNQQDKKSNIHKNIINILEEFSLFSNDAKNIEYNIPFITGVTKAKYDINELLNEFFDKYFPDNHENLHSASLSFYSKIAIKLINQMKCIVHDNGIPYSSITGYFFSIIKRKVTSIEENTKKHIANHDTDNLTKSLLIILDLSFFIYSMDFRVRSTYLISQIIILIDEIMKNVSKIIIKGNIENNHSTILLAKNNYDRIRKKIYDDTYTALNGAISKGQIRYIESLNLLIATRDINRGDRLPEDFLAKVLGISLGHHNQDEVTYFQLMTALFYSYLKKTEYNKLYTKVIEIIHQKLSNSDLTIFNSSELAHIFLDSLSCPYISSPEKLNIFNLVIDQYKDKSSINEASRHQLFEYISNRNWFIDWDSKSMDTIKKLLMKKELRQAYGN